MPKKVDRERKMQEIADKALELFKRNGYRESNLSAIADECGLSRPTVYQYFRDKNEIYYFVVRKKAAEFFEKLSEIAFSEDGGKQTERMMRIVDEIFSYASSNSSSLDNFVEFVYSETKAGADVNSALREKTARLRVLFCRMISRGKKEGSVKEINQNDAGEVFYSLMLSSMIQYVFMSPETEKESKKALSSFISLISV